jgi:transcription antitermination factor NusG
MSETQEILDQIAAYVDAAAARAVATMLPQWYAIQTQGRQEKGVAMRLSERGLSTYLPLVTEVRRWSDRRKRMEVPLFPGYVFVYTPMNDQIRVTALRAPGVTGFVTSQGQPVPIPDAEIESVQQLLSQSTPLHPHVFVSSGKRMRIRGGALDGLQGILIGTNPDWSLVISVELIQRSIALRLTGYDIEPV